MGFEQKQNSEQWASPLGCLKGLRHITVPSGCIEGIGHWCIINIAMSGYKYKSDSQKLQEFKEKKLKYVKGLIFLVR